MTTDPEVAGLPPLLIDATAACQLLSIGKRKLWELTNRNIIPHIRIGRLVRYSPAALSEWCSRQATSQDRASGTGSPPLTSRPPNRRVVPDGKTSP